MDLISTTSFKGRLGHIKRKQPFSTDETYGNELIKKKMAIEAPKNKAKAEPKNKSAGASASSSPAAPASPGKTQKKQNS
jgi:hypothetical protein